MWNKDVFRQMVSERINHQQNDTIRNVKESTSGRRKMTPYVKLNLHEWMKSTDNGKYVDIFFLVFYT